MDDDTRADAPELILELRQAVDAATSSTRRAAHLMGHLGLGRLYVDDLIAALRLAADGAERTDDHLAVLLDDIEAGAA